MYEQIKNMIVSKKKDIDDQTLYFLANYFYVLAERNLIPSEIKIEDLIDNALYYVQEIVFYDENSEIYIKLGKDAKGLRDPETKKIYVRNNLEEPLREMVIYHEIHHAVQTNRKTNEVGINQEFNVGRMIMEAQTQWFAEEIYKRIHNVDFEEREIPSEQLRMLGDGVVVSALHNYEMYDNILSKIAIILDVPKDYFVTINFFNDENKGLKLLEKLYNQKATEKQIKIPFYDLLYKIDYIYVTDYISYIEGKDKNTILSGKETEDRYQIYKDKGEKLSLYTQRKYINEFDLSLVLTLIDGNFDFSEFSKYIIDNNKRKAFEDYNKKDIK